jgi:anti-sigma factor RsiW
MNCKDIARLCPLYLFGELDAPSAREFLEHRQACHKCAAALDRQTQLDAALRSSVLSGEIDSAALDRRVRQHLAAKRLASSRRWLAVAAGIMVMLLAGTVGYRTMFAGESTRLCVEAAQDHRNEVTRGQRRTWLSDPRAIVDLAERSGIPGSLVTRLAPAGYRLEHGKLCGLDGRAFLHLVYAQGTHEFSAYLRPLDGRQFAFTVRAAVAAEPLHEADTGHEHISYFQTGQLTAIFVTEQSTDAASSIARAAARVL